MEPREEEQRRRKCLKLIGQRLRSDGKKKHVWVVMKTEVEEGLRCREGSQRERESACATRSSASQEAVQHEAK